MASELEGKERVTFIKSSTCLRLPSDVTERERMRERERGGGREAGRESGRGPDEERNREGGSWRAEQNTSVRETERRQSERRRRGRDLFSEQLALFHFCTAGL